MDQGDVKDCLKHGALTAHVHLHAGVMCDTVDEPAEPLWLEEGYYRLPPASVVALFSWFGGDREMAPVEVVAEEPDVRVTLPDSLARHVEARVLRNEVERYEREHLSFDRKDEKPPTSLRTSQEHRARCRALAQLLWEREPTLTIEAMIE